MKTVQLGAVGLFSMFLVLSFAAVTHGRVSACLCAHMHGCVDRLTVTSVTIAGEGPGGLQQAAAHDQRLAGKKRAICDSLAGNW